MFNHRALHSNQLLFLVSVLLRRRSSVIRVKTSMVLLLCLLACGGCGKEKSTDELITDLKSSSQEKERMKAARLLPQGQADAAKVVPALIEVLQGKQVPRPLECRHRAGGTMVKKPGRPFPRGRRRSTTTMPGSRGGPRCAVVHRSEACTQTASAKPRGQ